MRENSPPFFNAAGQYNTEGMFSTMIEKEKIYYEDYLGDVESIWQMDLLRLVV